MCFNKGPVASLLGVLSASSLQVSAPSGIVLITESHFVQGHSSSQGDPPAVTDVQS